MGLKYNVNEKFFNRWSNEMAYVLGYLYADGNMQDLPQIRGKYIRVSSTDEDRVLLIKQLMGSDHRVACYEKGINRKNEYHLRIGSHTLFDALSNIGMTPTKSSTMSFPTVPRKYLPPFVLGYFDGDGCAFIENDTLGRTKRFLSIFTSGSKRFLTTLHEHLVAETGVLGKGLYGHGSTKGAFQLRYSTRDSIRLFIYLYTSPDLLRLAMRRKYDIFIKYFKERELGPDDLAFILKQQGPVVKQKHD